MEANYKDLRRSIIDRGQFVIRETHAKFKLDRYAWIAKTEEEKNVHYNRFIEYKVTESTKVVSTDGTAIVPEALSKGKQPGSEKERKSRKRDL